MCVGFSNATRTWGAKTSGNRGTQAKKQNLHLTILGVEEEAENTSSQNPRTQQCWVTSQRWAEGVPTLELLRHLEPNTWEKEGSEENVRLRRISPPGTCWALFLIFTLNREIIQTHRQIAKHSVKSVRAPFAGLPLRPPQGLSTCTHPPLWKPECLQTSPVSPGGRSALAEEGHCDAHSDKRCAVIKIRKWPTM